MSGDDQLIGGGNDILVGGEGNDTYRFGRDFGHDVAIEQASLANQGNRVVFNADVAPGDVIVRKTGYDLTLVI